MRISRGLLGWWLVVGSGAAGCVPYTVATTAQPVPEGEVAPVLVMYSIPNGIDIYRDSTTRSSAPVSGLDMESRLGVTDRADVGVRIPSATGLIVNYKYRITPRFDHNAAALAIMVGGGFVNLGSHLHLETTLIASGRQAMFTPYGGLRLAQTLPLSEEAKSDSPTAGLFLGVRIGREQLGVSAELGVFYDRSVMGWRESDVIVVPALVLHGAELIRLVRDATGGTSRRAAVPWHTRGQY
jgi:hypothetical protein